MSIESTTNYTVLLGLIRLEEQNKSSSTGYFFASGIDFKTPRIVSGSGCVITDEISVDQCAQKLIDTLKEVFTYQKKESVTIQISGHAHGCVGRFNNNGEFVIVDPFKRREKTIFDWKDGDLSGVKKLAKRLNDAHIFGVAGDPISFRGKYIFTGLQKEGHTCEQISRLYQYQIAKEGDVKGWKSVCHAFRKKILTRFEDYDKIPTNHADIDTSTIPSEALDPFITSWHMRSRGCKKDSWRAITIEDLTTDRTIPETYAIIYRDSLPGLCQRLPEINDAYGRCFQLDPSKMKKIFAKEGLTLGELKPESAKKTRLVIVKKRKFSVRYYDLKKGESTKSIRRQRP